MSFFASDTIEEGVVAGSVAPSGGGGTLVLDDALDGEIGSEWTTNTPGSSTITVNGDRVELYTPGGADNPTLTLTDSVASTDIFVMAYFKRLSTNTSTSLRLVLNSLQHSGQFASFDHSLGGSSQKEGWVRGNANILFNGWAYDEGWIALAVNEDRMRVWYSTNAQTSKPENVDWIEFAKLPSSGGYGGTGILGDTGPVELSIELDSWGSNSTTYEVSRVSLWSDLPIPV